MRHLDLDKLRLPLFVSLALLIVFASSFFTVEHNAFGQEVSIATGKVRHVFLIVLENENYETTFGPSSKAPYLSRTLARRGAMLTEYYGTGHASLDNYVAMISGQASTPETTANCPIYADFKQRSATLALDGQIVGSGCVYPSTVQTLPDQLSMAHLTWKGYMGDMGKDPTRENATCGHPTLDTPDLTERAEAPSTAAPQGDQYATRHNPFMYFHSIIDFPACRTHVVNLENNLGKDLLSASTVANFTFISPSLCDDGHDAPCVNGQPGGLVSVNTFLQKWIPLIMASPAYKADGLIIINFDESSFASVSNDPSGRHLVVFTGAVCCNQQPGPNLAAFPQTEVRPNYTQTNTSYGGDRTGAVLLSPFIKPGTISNVPYNHYSVLRSIEDIFLLPHLGYAQAEDLIPLGPDIFTTLTVR